MRANGRGQLTAMETPASSVGLGGRRSKFVLQHSHTCHRVALPVWSVAPEELRRALSFFTIALPPEKGAACWEIVVGRSRSLQLATQGGFGTDRGLTTGTEDGSPFGRCSVECWLRVGRFEPSCLIAFYQMRRAAAPPSPCRPTDGFAGNRPAQVR